MFQYIFCSINRFLREEDGPTAVEYAVIAALIIGVCFASVIFLSDRTNESFDQSGNAIAGAFAN